MSARKTNAEFPSRRKSERISAPVPKPKRRGQRHDRVSPALARAAERALTITPEEVRQYQPRRIDVEIAEAMLAGQITIEELSAATGRSEKQISEAIRDQVAYAWVSQRVAATASFKTGIVIAAVLRRALRGDTKAAELFLRWNDVLKNKSASQHLHLHAQISQLEKMPDKDLDALIRAGEHAL